MPQEPTNAVQEEGDYSINSSARASRVGGTVRPSVFAVFRFITSSNFVGCSTGIAIAVVASKGGVGKTTLCANLAVRATKEIKRVALFDADPQQAVARWWQLRGAPDNPKLVAAAGIDLQDITPADVPGEVAKLKAKGWEYIFIDSPPALMHIAESVVMAADVVLIPVRASPIDLESINPTVELCEAHGKPFGFVLTHYDSKWKLSATAPAALEDMGKVFDETVAYRSAYVSSMVAGKTGPEAADRAGAKLCAEEVDELWKAVKRLAQTVKLARV